MSRSSPPLTLRSQLHHGAAMALNAKAAAVVTAYTGTRYAIISRIPLPPVAPYCPSHHPRAIDPPRCIARVVSQSLSSPHVRARSPHPRQRRRPLAAHGNVDVGRFWFQRFVAEIDGVGG